MADLVAGYKLFMGPSTGGIDVTGDERLRALFTAVAATGHWLFVHAEDGATIAEGLRRHGPSGAAGWHLARSAEAEIVATENALRLGRECGTRVHVFHLSSGDAMRRIADARATTACTLAVLERRDVLSFFQRHPSAWPGLVEMLCERLRSTDQQMAEMALLGLPARLAKTLLRMAAIQHPANGHAVPQIRLSQRELGNLVGATRESVNKCLRDWQRKGIVRTAESLIMIANRPALEDLAALEKS